MGAQKCVIQRVKNKVGQVCERVSGSNDKLVKKSRAWSIAMTTIISPRKMSSETMRDEATELLGDAVELSEGAVMDMAASIRP
jgi:hypothetical protein